MANPEINKEKIDKAVVEAKEVVTNLGYIAVGAGILVADKAKKITQSKPDFEKVKGKLIRTEKDKEEKENKLNLDELLKESIDEYNAVYTEISDNGMKLFTERQRSVDMIINIERLINSIANKPKSFDTDFAEITTKRQEFQGACDFAEKELEAAKKSAEGAGAGIATGVAVASLAPSVAMWVATTFGTASTGTAISSLSGAVATKAALAWLGGGALSAGGGGMAAGNALLALAGPVGWGIAGASVLVSVVLIANNKIKSNKQKKEEIEKIKKNAEALRESTAKVKAMYEKTATLRSNLFDQYNECMTCFAKSFDQISENMQYALMALVNNTKSLALTLSENLTDAR
ncbi:hypothetical protein MASR2M70_12830 [Bacillota bacterium]